MKPNLLRLLSAPLLAIAIVCPRLATAASPATRSSDVAKAAADMAQELFDRGKARMAKGELAPAAELFQESLRLDPAIGTEFHLAACYEKMGRLALAWSHFNAVAEMAKQQGSRDREEVARGQAQALEGRIGRVAIQFPARLSAIAGLVVVLDNRPLAPARWLGGATAMEVIDPGEHTLEAMAPGIELWRHALTVKAGTTVAVTVDAFPAGEPGNPETKIQPAPVIFGSVGSALALGAGVGLLLYATAAKEAYDGNKEWLTNARAVAQPPCGRGTPLVKQCESLADSYRNWKPFESGAIGAFVLGGVLAAGTLTHILWPRKTLGAPPVEIESGFGNKGGRFLIRGRF